MHATLARAPDGAAGVFHSLRIMRELVRAYRVNPAIIQAATGVIFTTPEKNEAAEIRALFEFVRDHVRYTRDVLGVETIADPLTTLRRQSGDCDDQVTLLCSLCESVGYPTRFVVAGYSSQDFEHVYAQIFVYGSWIDADPTERGDLGYSPPDPLIVFIEETA